MRFVTSVATRSLSSSRDWACAVVCITAVKNDVGLNSPLNHVTTGMSVGPFVHSLSCSNLPLRLASHVVSPRIEG